MGIFRQGDVLLVASTLPNELVKLPSEGGRIVLAHGEVTGHAHAIAEERKAAKFESAGKTFLQVLEEVGLRHEEHAEIRLPAGVYQVLIQTEYVAGEIRNVQD